MKTRFTFEVESKHSIPMHLKRALLHIVCHTLDKMYNDHNADPCSMPFNFTWKELE